MKKIIIFPVILALALSAFISGCSKKTTEDPCNGSGTLNVENKLDSTITVTILQTHSTQSIQKDHIQPFSMTGDQPYEFTIDGPGYHKDTTIMVLVCDNKLYIVTK
jgi:hypothetical protein